MADFKFSGMDDDAVKKWAFSLGEKYGVADRSGGGAGNTGDAARHIALGWAAGKADEELTIPRAKFLVQAKEYSPTSFLRRRDLDRPMDKHNNEVGFRLAQMTNTEEEFLAALDKVMDPNNLIMVQSVDDLPDNIPELQPIFVEPKYRMYKGGYSASDSPGRLPPKKKQ
tara:strand:+ start:357 stop:863 length:507 start_codon:yes stop_codon:yes gene_type:complete